MLPRRRTAICPEGWYYLGVMAFIIAGALLREINLLVLLFCLMLGPLLLNWRMAVAALKKINVDRAAPKTVTAGDAYVVNLHAENQRRHGSTWSMVVEDPIRRVGGSKEDSETSRVFFGRITPKSPLIKAYEARLPRRGRYRLGPLRLSTRFPLGLVRRSVILKDTSTLIVHPRPGRLLPAWKNRRQRSWHGMRSARDRHGLAEGDFHSLRDYRAGDAQRWIHWRTTARKGELMVRQFEQPKQHDLALLLNLRTSARPSLKEREDVELAVSFAVSVAIEQCRLGSSLLLIAVGGATRELVRGTASRPLLEEVLNRLAEVEASAEDQLGPLLEAAVPQIPPGCDVVLATTEPANLTARKESGSIAADARQRACLERMLVLDVSANDLFQYYRPN